MLTRKIEFPMPRFILKITDSARRLVAEMSLRELLLQVTVPALVHLENGPEASYGGLFLHRMVASERRRVVAQLQSHCAIPPFLVADIEYGPNQPPEGLGIEFPPLMSHGVVHDPDLTFRLARASGRIARSQGFHWALGPCVDLAGHPDSPMVSVRSAGESPDRVARVGEAFARGLQEAGLLATAKHFPGDGFTSLDQHLTTPVVEMPMAEWETGPGKVYRVLIEAGLKAIMPGHIAYPALDPVDPTNGLPPPASLSSRILKGLLKEELGFDGLIISDAVNMTGFCGFMEYHDACARFLEAGGDVLLFPKVDEHFLREMEKRVSSGVLSENTLRQRVTRILAMKEHLGLLHAQGGFEEVSFEKEIVELSSIAPEVARRAVRILRDRKGMLPLRLSPQSKVLHLTFANVEPRFRPHLASLTELLAERVEVEEWTDPGCDRLFDAVREGAFDAIICSVACGVEYGSNVVRLHGRVARNMMSGWMKLGTPTVFIAHSHPYLVNEYEAAIDCCLATFGTTLAALETLVAGLFGDLELPRAGLAEALGPLSPPMSLPNTISN